MFARLLSKEKKKQTTEKTTGRRNSDVSGYVYEYENNM